MTLKERSQLNDFLIVEKWKTTTPQNILQICTDSMYMHFTHTHTHTHTHYRNQPMQAWFGEKNKSDCLTIKHFYCVDLLQGMQDKKSVKYQ